jgi:hypothetical protein
LDIAFTRLLPISRGERPKIPLQRLFENSGQAPN